LLITSLSLLLFFFHRSAHHRDLHSFPTRRSSDLEHADGVKRLEFLMTQRDDLVAARNSLQQAAREIDQTAKQLFLDAFGKVRENFRAVFQTLFGGGECDVRLANEDEPLTSEIEIHA